MTNERQAIVKFIKGMIQKDYTSAHDCLREVVSHKIRKRIKSSFAKGDK